MPFNPTSLVGTQGGFWRADAGVTLSGSNVTGWADQGAHGLNMSVNGIGTIGQTSPTFSATGFNTSFPALIFVDNGNTGLTTTAASPLFNSTTLSFYALLSSNPTNDNRCAWLAQSSNDFTTPNMIFVEFDNAPAKFYCYSSGKLGNGGSSLNFTASTPRVLGCILDGSFVNLTLDFVTTGTGSAFSTSIDSNGGVGFGVGKGTNGTSGDMQLAYMLLTNNLLSGTDISNLISWTNTNWGTSFPGGGGGGGGAAFRSTLSGLGTRSGARQVIGD